MTFACFEVEARAAGHALAPRRAVETLLGKGRRPRDTHDNTPERNTTPEGLDRHSLERWRGLQDHKVLLTGMTSARGCREVRTPGMMLRELQTKVYWIAFHRLDQKIVQPQPTNATTKRKTVIFTKVCSGVRELTSRSRSISWYSTSTHQTTRLAYRIPHHLNRIYLRAATLENKSKIHLRHRSSQS